MEIPGPEHGCSFDLEHNRLSGQLAETARPGAIEATANSTVCRTAMSTVSSLNSTSKPACVRSSA